MRRSSSAAFCASRSAIRRLISAAENIPAVAGFAVSRLSDMISPPFPGTSGSHQRAGMATNHQVFVGFNLGRKAAGQSHTWRGGRIFRAERLIIYILENPAFAKTPDP